MDKSEDYQVYASYQVKDIPQEKIKSLIESFMFEASLNMGNSFDDRDLNRIIYIINSDFNFLPISYIASGFIRGSLGKFGTGRLIPRTVYGWLNEVSNEYWRKAEHQKMEEHYKVKNTGFDLIKYPVGQAIAQKIDWYNAGLLVGDEWDKVPLKKLAEDIAQGKSIKLENYFT